jgi:hypothetical protein
VHQPFSVRIAGGVACCLVVVLAACGLDMNGLAQDVTQGEAGVPEGGGDTGATLDAPESGGGTDATSTGETSVDAPADVSVAKDAAGCQSSSDCAGSLFGSQCIDGACGCNSEDDCPASEYAACKDQVCTSSCTGGLQCNHGCCDSTSTCVPGEDTPAACGTDGDACQVCGDDTPTCSGGSCTSDCGSAGDGTCGAGFCCQEGSCTAIADDACAPAGGTCLDCTTSSVAPVCLPNGTCGCSKNNDCQDGDYPVCLSNGTCGCDTSGDCGSPNLCGNNVCQPPLSCGIGNACSNGNCCAGTKCSDGCASCQLGFCVCQKASDCPSGTTCHCPNGGPPCTGFGTCS